MAIYMHQEDIPDNLVIRGDIAIDTEAMGLNHNRDRLCLLQFSDGMGDVHLVQFQQKNYNSPNLKKILLDKTRVKIFHFARFDVAIIYRYMGILVDNIYCTKIASKIARTYTDSHGLKELCRELLSINISKQQQSSYWGAETLTSDQKNYAAADVLHLHDLRDKLNAMILREGRENFVEQCFQFLSTRIMLDVAGWNNVDIFAH